jgi:hypothetical protein
MSFNHYLRQMGTLYVQGAVSSFHPNRLRRFGGSLLLAAVDSNDVRVEEDGFLWFDLHRNPRAQWLTAERVWERHVQGIREIVEQGETPSSAIYTYLRRFNTYPHAPQQLHQMLRRVSAPWGRDVLAWKYSTLEERQRMERTGRVLGNTFGAVTTMAALALTADSWTAATPAEWDRALNFGEVGVLVGDIAGARYDGQQQFGDSHRTATQHAR